MKSRLTPNLPISRSLWNWLTIVCVSLTGLTCLTYGLIWVFPQLVPGRLRPATPAALATSVPRAALNPTEAFPTLPPEWTAAFILRQTPSAPGVVQPAATLPPATPQLTSTSAPSPAAALSPTAAASQTPIASTAVSPTAPPSPEATAGATAYPAPGTPTAPSGTGYPYPSP